MMNLNARKNIKILISLLIMFFSFYLTIKKSFKKLKIGVIGVRHDNNIGNNLIKYSIFIKLSELGFIPYIIGTHLNNYNISFLNKSTNLIIIKNDFNEIKKEDYDILMVNSDQTWRRFDNYFYDYAFLLFAKNWNITKFIYGASLGFDYWTLNSSDETIAKKLLTQFSGISVREENTINLIQSHLGFKPILVLDPTLLIDKQYYLNIIKHYKSINNYENNFIFSYKIVLEDNMENFIINSSRELNYTIYNYPLNNQTIIEEFIYQTFKCKAIVTNSYHGVIFAIIFNKPFVAFIFENSPKERLISLGNILDIKNRIFEYNEYPDVKLLNTPLNINFTKLNSLKLQSINYIKKNLKILK